MRKNERPYYILTIEVDSRTLTFAIPLHSKIRGNHKYYCAKEGRRGLDYPKAVIIDKKFIDLTRNIPKDEFNFYKCRENEIKRNFTRFVESYIKERKRRLENEKIPDPTYFEYTALQYFHTELGIGI